ncbi:hypothetical protein CGRA01v4_00848 [Colletotrichum graminicola]|nr:hypothetical protein CGRA01v4_00848 [Colletotrichum graminicola]
MPLSAHPHTARQARSDSVWLLNLLSPGGSGVDLRAAEPVSDVKHATPPPTCNPALCFYVLPYPENHIRPLRMCHYRDNLLRRIAPPCRSLRRVLSLTLWAHIPHMTFILFNSPIPAGHPGTATGQHRQGCSRYDERTGQIMAGSLAIPSVWHLAL